MFKLVIQDDEGKTTVVPLIRDEITIGRKEGNTIRLTERNVSRRHARIVRMNGTVAIEDLGSYNGVRVNGTRIAQRTALTISDRVQIGDYLIELKAEGAEVGVAGADDGKTQPIERIDPAILAARGGMPTPVMVGQPHATMVALADTDPNQQAARIAQAAGMPMAVAPAPSGFARLVILSSNFAGQEFELTKPQMIIGRTDDNDVVVNHRSISRNHAKIVREQDTGRYTISDLASSNGVRVNGEEYGKVELRRGDTIDLGHVRMRFVEPGEDFLFGRDAQAVDVPTGGGKKGLILGLVGLLVVGGIVVAVMASGGGGGTSAGSASAGTGTGTNNQVAPGPSDAQQMIVTTADAEVGSAAGTASGSQIASGTDTGTGSAVVPPGNDAAAKKLDECKSLRDKDDWTGLAACASDLAKLDPNNADAKDLSDLAKKEVASSLVFDDLKSAMGKKDYGSVKQYCDKLPDDSVYKDKSRQLCDKAKDDFIAEMTARARSLASQHKCKDIAKLAQQAGKLWPEAKDAVDAVNCTEQVAGGGSNTHQNPPGGGSGTDKPPGGGSGTASPPPGGGNPGQLIDDARAAAKNSQWGKALRLCEEALQSDRGNADAIMVCALASCNLKNTAKAKSYIGKLSSSRQGMARQSCLRNGIDPGGS
ncbi:MAG TPA: FHA domain-containing protein [Kofleriaceae bacterium]|jgi:pSer/pThr/pTyr-binding forkhead associated (FHA) protein|nr:FHA domain-containing protein [Kofleriaceae bacterium]